MSLPSAFAGSASDGSVWLLNSGNDDAGLDIPVRVQSNPVAPAGANADCTFDRLFVTLTWSIGVTLRVTPIVDGDKLEDAQFDIVLDRPYGIRRQSQVFEKILRLTAIINGEPAFKYVPRGTWFAVLIETVGGRRISLADLATYGGLPGEVTPDGTVLRDPESVPRREGDVILDSALLEFEVLSPTKELV